MSVLEGETGEQSPLNMSNANAYRSDPAYIHGTGFGKLAKDSSPGTLSFKRDGTSRRLAKASLLLSRCLAAGAQSSYLFVTEQRTQLAANEPTALAVRLYAQHARCARQADAAASARQLYDEPCVYGQRVFED